MIEATDSASLSGSVEVGVAVAEGVAAFLAFAFSRFKAARDLTPDVLTGGPLATAAWPFAADIVAAFEGWMRGSRQHSVDMVTVIIRGAVS